MSIKSHPTRFFLLLFILLAAAIGVGLWVGLAWKPLWAGLVGVNAVAPLLWIWDKNQARRGGWRVPEACLHVMAALGATPASFVSMLVLRHKIRKPVFWTLYTIFALAQFAAFFYLSGRFAAENT